MEKNGKNRQTACFVYHTVVSSPEKNGTKPINPSNNSWYMLHPSPTRYRIALLRNCLVQKNKMEREPRTPLHQVMPVFLDVFSFSSEAQETEHKQMLIA